MSHKRYIEHKEIVLHRDHHTKHKLFQVVAGSKFSLALIQFEDVVNATELNKMQSI